MDSGDKQDHEGQSGETLEDSSASSRHVSVQESKVNVVQPALCSDERKFSTEELTRVFIALSYTYISSAVYSYSSGIVPRCGVFGG
ncbi:hypothetical protein J1N35_011793 [Gossypium stocksii]|uniref:Uncharacterized protein n=1 Tax=Gossypium stocksii TaxID=47602 RepID=A0A9D3W557_9ROSI|nr:hypothetical protein J1N35_011793 [Gossypium stocksii]